MAKLQGSFVRLRFSLGKGNVKGRQRFENTASFTAGAIAVQHADDMWKQAKASVADQVKLDVERELVQTAYLFRRNIASMGGNRSGTLNSAFGGVPPQPLTSALPAWAPRNAKYLQRKKAGGGGDAWFNNSKWKARKSHTGKFYPVNPGLLGKSIDKDFFTRVYGPIAVSVVRDNKTDPNDAQALIALGKKRDMKIQVATIRVNAMSKINPGNLPILRTGTFGDSNPAIPRMIYDSGIPYAKEIGSRLGPVSAGRGAHSHGIYRPTLEPFLGYFLTRSIPAAVMRRIGKGSLGRITRA